MQLEEGLLLHGFPGVVEPLFDREEPGPRKSGPNMTERGEPIRLAPFFSFWDSDSRVCAVGTQGGM